MPKLDPVKDTNDGRNFTGSGFLVRYDNNRPAVSFSFLTKAEADAAHVKMQEIIALCKHIHGY
jgi:hypothetical protein